MGLCSVKIPAWSGQNEGPSHPQLLFSRFVCARGNAAAGRSNKLLSPEAAQFLDPAGGKGKRSSVCLSLLLPVCSRSCPSRVLVKWSCSTQSPLAGKGLLAGSRILWR